MPTKSELVEAVKPTLVTAPDDPVAKTVTVSGLSIFDLLDRQQDQFVRAMGDMAGASRMIRVITSEIRKNPKLGECTVTSLLGAAMLSAQLRLEPGPLEQCYLIPRWNKKLGSNEVNWQLGYKGMIELATRSGRVSSIFTDDVRENDRWVNIKGFEPRFEHEWAQWGDRGETLGYYCLTRLGDGTYRFPMVLDLDEIQKAKEASDSWQTAEHKDPKKWYSGKKDSAWHLWERSMALKTTVRREWTYLPRSIEMGDAVSADESIVDVPDPESIGGFDDLSITPTRELEADADAVSPELEPGAPEQITIQAVPDAPAADPAPAAAGGVAVDELVALAKNAGLIPQNAKAATASKALLPIGNDAGAGEYGDAETLAVMAGEQVAAWLQAKIDEGGAK